VVFHEGLPNTEVLLLQRFRVVGVILLCLGISASTRAQNAPAVSTPATAPLLHFGRSLSPLNGPWKFHIGDSPLIPGTNQPLWASPSFDDSHWETVDLTPPVDSFDPVAGISNYVPGWTKRGHPGYWGYAWYRLRIQVSTRPGVALDMEGPSDVDDAYQVFDNGTLLGSFGKFSATKPPVAYNTRPSLFHLPQADGTQVIAFRMWMEPSTIAAQADVGGLHSAPLLGEASAVEAHYQVDWVQGVRAYGNAPILGALYLLLTIVACSLLIFDSSDRVYLWLAAAFLLAAIHAISLALTAWTQIEPADYSSVEAAMTIPLMLGAWLMVWWTWFRLHRPAWMPRLIAALTAAYVVSNTIAVDVFFGLVSQPVVAAFHVVTLVIRLAILLLLVFIVDRGIREQGREGWLALPAVILVGIAQFQIELTKLGFHTVWFPFGAQVTISTIAYIFLVGVMLVLLLRRLSLSMRRQREITLDLKQAQEVQHVLLPEPVTVPGLHIETEYLPAREVGGDFFQIVPHRSDGSLLIVAGDVVGKGLQAGMLVALLVGAIRSTLESTNDPKLVLEALNRRLLGRGDSHATCLALHLAPGGAVILANAGHLPPYVNGVEVPMQGALPLGSIAGADFPVSHFQLAQGDILTLISDGIVEAQDKDRRLFGFDRVRDLLHTKVSPAALAAAAQHFGQEDDISIVSVTRFA
jgi:hypothetical protein